MSDLLNLNQSSEELKEVHGTDYYWYLRSPEFMETFIRPMAAAINSLGQPCLDVGCGEGYLYDYLKVPYKGVDGSESAIAKGWGIRPAASLQVGRIEDPQVGGYFGTIVFGGIFSVLVRKDRQEQFLQLYEKYEPHYLVIYDLKEFDQSWFDARFDRIFYLEGIAHLKDLTPEIKLHRKVMIYDWRTGK